MSYKARLTSSILLKICLDCIFTEHILQANLTIRGNKMGIAKVLLKSGNSIQCQRAGGDNRDSANAIINEVRSKKGKEMENSFVMCENGGGFDANEVEGVTIPDSIQRPSEE